MRSLCGADADGRGFTAAAGLPVRAMAWAPPGRRDGADAATDYVLVAPYPGAPKPLLPARTPLPAAPAALQLWALAPDQAPRLALLLVHQHAAVWSVAWADRLQRDVRHADVPSAKRANTNANSIRVRRARSGTTQPVPRTTDGGVPRLGLVALACADGAVVLAVVPHPSAVPSQAGQIRMCAAARPAGVALAANVLTHVRAQRPRFDCCWPATVALKESQVLRVGRSVPLSVAWAPRADGAWLAASTADGAILSCRLIRRRLSF